MKPEQQEILGRKFGQWLVEAVRLTGEGEGGVGRRGAREGRLRAGQGRALHHLLPDAAAAGPHGEAAARPDGVLRRHSAYQFYTDIAAYYRNDLGCKQLINASNWITADPVHLNDLER